MPKTVLVIESLTHKRILIQQIILLRNLVGVVIYARLLPRMGGITESAWLASTWPYFQRVKKESVEGRNCPCARNRDEAERRGRGRWNLKIHASKVLFL